MASKIGHDILTIWSIKNATIYGSSVGGEGDFVVPLWLNSISFTCPSSGTCD